MLDFIVNQSRQFVNIFFYAAIVIFPIASSLLLFISEKSKNQKARASFFFLSMFIFIVGACYIVIVTIFIYWLTENINIAEKLFISGGTFYYLFNVPRLFQLSRFNKMYPIIKAIQNGDYSTVKDILYNGFNPNTRIQPDNRLALHMAVAYGQNEIVQLLLKYGAEVDAISVGHTAIITATANEQPEIVKLLLGAKADPNLIVKPKNILPLHMAASFGNNEIVELLIRHGADVNAIVEGKTALSWAVSEGHADVVKQLLEAKANPNARNSSDDILSLHLAAHFGHKDIVDLLLMYGAEVDALCSGKSALLEAIEVEDIAIVNRLLEAKADPNMMMDGLMAPLHYAIMCRNHTIVSLLVRAGADPYLLPNSTHGMKPITFAHIKEYDDLVKILSADKMKSMRSAGRKTFISYRTVDVLLVRLIAEQLMVRGAPIWFDEYFVMPRHKERILKNINEFNSIIDEAVDESKSAICFTNKSFANSIYCVREANVLTTKLPHDQILNIACPEHKELYVDAHHLEKCPIVHLQNDFSVLSEDCLEELWKKVSEHCSITYMTLLINS